MKEQLIRILADYRGVDAGSIRTDMTFAEMGLDSLDVAELILRMEDELGVSVEMSDDLNTVDRIAAFLEEGR